MLYSTNSNIKILVIGDMMIDHYIYGDCNRISPEAPVPIVEVHTESYMLGGAGNVLKNLLAFKIDAKILSVVGADTINAKVFDILNELEVASDGLTIDSDRCTTVKSRVISVNHQLIRVDRENTKPINSMIEDELIRKLETEITQYRLVLISDYKKGLLTDRLLGHIFEICKAAGIKTILDPKGNSFEKYKGVNIIKPNKKEASIATGIAITDKESLLEACKIIKKTTHCDAVIVTLSEDGIACFTDGQLTINPTKVIDVIDVTGAGDTVLASLGIAIAAGKDLQYACNFANHAAAIVVSKVGSATVSIDEINSKLSAE